jgi:hypothetical protein
LKSVGRLTDRVCPQMPPYVLGIDLNRSESRRRARAQPLILRSNASLARGRRSLVGRLVARRTAEPGRPQVLGANLKCSESGCLVVEDLYGVSTAPLLTDLRG